MRRSTRTRSASQEARVSKKPKSSSRVKESTLPTVRESPGKRSSGLVSGFKAQNLNAVSKERQEMVDNLVDGLQELWTTSNQLLNKLWTETPTRSTVNQITERLQTSTRFQKDILLQHEKLKEVMSKYPGMPINVSTTNLQLFGQRDAERDDQEAPRPDIILYNANLAYAIGVLVVAIIDGMDDFDSEEMLRLFFQTFSRVVKATEKVTRGSTSSWKATFDLALELQTNVFWENLDDARADDIRDVNEFDMLSGAFYDKTGLRGWNVDGLRGGDFKQDQRQAIINRIATANEILNSNKNWDRNRAELIYQCFSWSSQRNSEIKRLMSKVPDGVLGIQEAIDEEIKHLGISVPEDTIHLKTNLAQSAFVRPEALSRVKASIKGTGRSATAPSSARRQQSSDEASAVTALARQAEPDIDSADHNDESFEPALFVGDEGFEDPSDSANVVRDTEHFEPTEEQRMRLSQHVSMRTKQANKENLPHRGLKADQLLKQSQRPGNSESGQGISLANKGKNKRDHTAYEEDDDDHNIDLSQDGDDHDDDGGFQTQKTPEKAHRQRPQQIPSSKPTPSRVAFSSAAGNDDAQPNLRATSQAEPSRTQRADMYHAVNMEAKERMAEMKVRNKPQVRIAWSDEEMECLLKYIDEYGTQWQKMKEHDGSSHGHNILHRRDNVALKDKARNMKLDFLKANRPLPPGLDLVTLRKSDEKKLSTMGLYDDPDER